MSEVPRFRCAIYTRTSSDENLIQDYNSLAAQRDACAAYILSQKHEGWVRTSRVYEDGGFSGGNLDRPALRDLVRDMAAGEIDIVAIYKIDRLTRSLRDFARLSETFERSGVSFVAVTQQFNTASSMGRLTLNILLTFAQFEREMASDRIRDKKTASTRLGNWTGGNPALGYDAPAKKLVVNPEEADAVRYIFRRFVELESMAELRKDLVRAGIVSKKRVRKGDQTYGGVNITWHPLHKILTNPLYKGVIRQKGRSFPGRHEAIIDEAQFDQVQRLVKQVGDREKARRAQAYPALLRGILFDIAGNRSTPGIQGPRPSSTSTTSPARSPEGRRSGTPSATPTAPCGYRRRLSKSWSSGPSRSTSGTETRSRPPYPPPDGSGPRSPMRRRWRPRSSGSWPGTRA